MAGVAAISRRVLARGIYSLNQTGRRLLQTLIGVVIGTVRFLANIALLLLATAVPNRNDLWVLGSHFGYADNAKYMFLYLVHEKPEVDAMWLTTDRETARALAEDGYPATYAYSFRGIVYLLRARFVLVTRALSDIGPWGSVYPTTTVLLGHGIPIMESTYEDDWWTHFKQKWTIKNFSKFVVTSEDYPKQAYERTNYYALDQTKLLVTNYPRTDLFFEENHVPDVDGSIDVSALNSLPSRSFVTYLPTRRKYETENPLLDNKEALERMDKFMTSLDAHLIVKLHPSDRRDATFAATCNRISVVSKDVDIYPLLRDTDVLITDFSSVYLDYLLLDRPIVFFPYDFDRFSDSRRMIFKYDEVTPGPKAGDIEELQEALRQSLSDPDLYATERETIRSAFYQDESWNAAERIFKHVSTDVSP
jgi:CDP-glycerol glycerophosphotransferase (TagB/SpsB family)